MRLTSREVCQRAGVTYRQLDYWTVLGVFSAAPTPGSGRRRFYSLDDLILARRMRRLLDAGIAPSRVVQAAVSGSLDDFVDDLARALVG